MRARKYFNSEYCLECHLEIKCGDKVIELPVFGNRKYYVHGDGCWEQYQRLLFEQEKSKKSGLIDVCIHCAKPIRINQEFSVGRLGRHDDGNDEHIFLNSFPNEINGHELTFAHSECENQAYGEEDDEDECKEID